VEAEDKGGGRDMAVAGQDKTMQLFCDNTHINTVNWYNGCLNATNWHFRY
jgi:hypothetical protein